jgi:magnesium-transporting ATPase (P-type)
MTTSSADDKVHESKHIAFMSSQVMNGEGYGVVVRCGDHTFIGKINALASGTVTGSTTLQRDIHRFVKFIAIVAVTMAIILFSIGMARRMKFIDAFVNGIVVVLVANIPQGLPATVTSALTLTAERMKDVSVLVKRTDIIESLGSANRIASDKTGTLTQNKMTVMNCWVNRQFKSAAEIVTQVKRPFSPSQSRVASTFNKLKQLSMRRRSNVPLYAMQGPDMAIAEKEVLMLPPGGADGPVAGPLSRASTRQGVDMLSRMSMGRHSNSGKVQRPTCCPPFGGLMCNAKLSVLVLLRISFGVLPATPCACSYL